MEIMEYSSKPTSDVSRSKGLRFALWFRSNSIVDGDGEMITVHDPTKSSMTGMASPSTFLY
uniref:Uncharacterized protein n=1 Tax=Romanomermis culicivorax TaxID=13658 RepID=A0A915HWW4_ROMCU